MNPIRLIDIVLWLFLATAYFRGWNAGFYFHKPGEPKFSYGPWSIALVQAVAVVLPLGVMYISPSAIHAYYWDALIVIAVSVMVAPLAFPHLTVQLAKSSLGEKIWEWVLRRFDIAVKKAVAVLIAAGLLVLVFKVAPAAAEPRLLLSPGYFGSDGLIAPGLITVAALVIATFTTGLRFTVLPLLSKTFALTFPFIVYGMMGYAADLTSSIVHSSTHFTIGLMATVIVDLVVYIIREFQGGN